MDRHNKTFLNLALSPRLVLCLRHCCPLKSSESGGKQPGQGLITRIEQLQRQEFRYQFRWCKYCFVASGLDILSLTTGE